METESGNKEIGLFLIFTVCYLDENDVVRNKVLINIVDESNKDRSQDLLTPTEELLVPPENRLELFVYCCAISN